jgi:hypothetical protein
MEGTIQLIEEKKLMAFARLIRLMTQSCQILAILAFGLFCAGCGLVSPPQQSLTPTPNPTLLAISRMLTETRAAPTTTSTLTPSPTLAVTPSLTVEIPVTGDRKLPAAGGTRFVTKEGTAVTILAVQRVKTLSRLKALEGSAYLDFEVLLENPASQVIPYNPLDFRLSTAAGSLLQPTVDALAPVLLSGDLQPGDWVRGHLAYAITEDETPSMLRYLPAVGPTRSNAETWFDLKAVSDKAKGIAPEIAGKQAWPGKDLPQTGGRQEAKGIALTVEKVDVTNRLPIRKAENGMRFVTLAVKIENTGHTRAPYNSLYFRVKDADGFEYLPILGSPDTSLQAGSLGRGQMVRNIIIFEVPETDQVLLLTYLPTVIAEEYAPIRNVVALP